MSYKKGLSKSRFKQTMRMFWTERWKYERTPEEWVECLNYKSTYSSELAWKRFPYGKRATDLLFSALDKLVLERKLTKEQGENLKEMIESPDRENALVAITVMATVKPKKFKKLIT